MVVTAAEQNPWQAPGVSTITADEIPQTPPARDVLGDHSHHAGSQPDRQLHQRASAATTARLISAAWARKIP